MNSEFNGLSYTTLPKGWQWVKLGEVVEQDKTTLKPNDELCSRLPYVSLEHVEPETGRINGFGKSTIRSNTFIFDERHVLYGKLRPYLNKVATPDFRGRCTTEIIPLIPKGITREYLAHFLRLPETVEYAMMGKTGSRMPRTDMRAFMHLLIPLPPFAEQQRIVRMLDEKLATNEQAKWAVEAQYEAADALPESCFRNVIPDTDVALAEGWEFVKLGDICEINPRRPKGIASDIDAPTTFVPMAAVDAETGRISQPQERAFSDVSRGYTYFQEGDVLFAKITPCMQNGKHAIAKGLIDGFGFGTTEFHVLRPSDVVMAEWIYRYVTQRELLELATHHFRGAVGQQRLPKEFLAELTIPLPPFAEQERFTRALDEKSAIIEKAKRMIDDQLRAWDSLPTAYLRKAFAGEL